MPQFDPLPPGDYRAQPSLFVIADPYAPMPAIRAAALEIDARLLGPVEPEAAAVRLDAIVATDAVLLAISRDDPAILSPLLDRLEIAAADRVHGVVLLLPPELIDVAAARAPSAQLVCEPRPGDLASALAEAVAPFRPALHDVGRESNTLRLRQLSEEVGRIARTLATLSAPAGTLPPPRGDDVVPADTDSGAIRAIIRARRMRDQFFPRDLFADPSWDILLDLMAARIERQQVAVSSLCIAAAVPPTTALRHIKTMTEQGLLVRVADAQDGRRVFIELSDGAAAAMDRFLAALKRTGTAPV